MERPEHEAIDDQRHRVPARCVSEKEKYKEMCTDHLCWECTIDLDVWRFTSSIPVNFPLALLVLLLLSPLMPANDLLSLHAVARKDAFLTWAWVACFACQAYWGSVRLFNH